MKIVTARELKNRTGKIIREAREGEQFLVTVRGKPAAAIAPAAILKKESLGLRPPEESWADIEETLKASAGPFKDWREAMAWVRKRG